MVASKIVFGVRQGGGVPDFPQAGVEAEKGEAAAEGCEGHPEGGGAQPVPEGDMGVDSLAGGGRGGGIDEGAKRAIGIRPKAMTSAASRAVGQPEAEAGSWALVSVRGPRKMPLRKRKL